MLSVPIPWVSQSKQCTWPTACHSLSCSINSTVSGLTALQIKANREEGFSYMAGLCSSLLLPYVDKQTDAENYSQTVSGESKTEIQIKITNIRNHPARSVTQTSFIGKPQRYKWPFLKHRSGFVYNNTDMKQCGMTFPKWI